LKLLKSCKLKLKNKKKEHELAMEKQLENQNDQLEQKRRALEDLQRTINEEKDIEHKKKKEEILLEAIQKQQVAMQNQLRQKK